MASAASPIIPGTQEPYRYFEENTTTTKKVVIIVRDVFIGLIAAGLCLYNPVVFVPFILVGIFAHDFVESKKEDLVAIFKINRVATIAIVGLAAFLSFPISLGIGGAVTAIWCGSRLVNIGRGMQLNREMRSTSAAI